jgi:hypothetical protein
VPRSGGAPEQSLEFIGIQRIMIRGMSRRPRVTGSDLLAALRKAGFALISVLIYLPNTRFWGTFEVWKPSTNPKLSGTR